MTIVGLFRRYKRWSPVHPTHGAFWGMGVGLGCGVGWGPGFGPDVVGYVGAGCGLGFSVGITLIGVGLGLPATTGITCLPYNLFLWTAYEVRNLASCHVIPALTFGSQRSWNALLIRSVVLWRGFDSLFQNVFEPKCREVIDNMQVRVLGGVEKVKFRKLKLPCGRKFSSRLQMKVIRGFQGVSRHSSDSVEISNRFSSVEVAEPRDSPKQENPERISIEYVEEPHVSCRQVHLCRGYKGFKKCSLKLHQYGPPSRSKYWIESFQIRQRTVNNSGDGENHQNPQ